MKAASKETGVKSDASDYADSLNKLDLEDNNTIDKKALTDLAMQAEEKMLNVKGVTNTEGASASTSRTEFSFLSSKVECPYNRGNHE